MTLFRKVVLERIQGESKKRDQELEKTINSLLHHQRLNSQISNLQVRKEILAHIYNSASNYTNLVMIGGYAGIFAVWQLTRDHLTRPESLVVSVLFSISILLFAGFEVWKMIAQAFFFRRLQRILSLREPDQEAAWQIAWTDFASKQSRIWLFFLIPTVVTGFGAGIFLLWHFMGRLWFDN